jgi:hypothetical protein
MSKPPKLRHIAAGVVIQFINEYHSGRWPNLRFGQAFVNEFLPDDNSPLAQDLFYSENDQQALETIMTWYQKKGL